jgi:hypothetical protein
MSKSNTLSIVAANSFDSIGALKSAAQSISAGANALEIINTKAKELRENGVKFGKSIKTCMHRRNLADAMAAEFKGKTAKTYANYVTSFVGAVNDNVPFSFSASKGDAAPKGDAAQKSTPKTDAEKMLGALLNVWKLSDVAENLMIEIEGALADGTPLAEAIGEVLAAHGVDVE